MFGREGHSSFLSAKWDMLNGMRGCFRQKTLCAAAFTSSSDTAAVLTGLRRCKPANCASTVIVGLQAR